MCNVQVLAVAHVFFNSKGNVAPDILKYACRFVFSP